MRCLRFLVVFLVISSTIVAQSKIFSPPVVIKDLRIFPDVISTADFNLDGNKDILVTNGFILDPFNGPASIGYLDSSYALKEIEKLPYTGEVGAFTFPEVIARDLNKDGLPDVILCSERGSISSFLGKGPYEGFKFGMKPKQIALMSSPNNEYYKYQSNGFVVGDFNRDGNLDLIMTGNSVFLIFQQEYTGLLLFAGDGKGGFGREQNLLYKDVISIDKADLNGDGYSDIVALDAQGFIHLFYSTKGGHFNHVKWLCSSPKKPRLIKAGDINDDGRDELLVGGGDTVADATVYIAGTKDNWDTKIGLALGNFKANRVESMLFQDLTGNGESNPVFLVSYNNDYAKIIVYKSILQYKETYDLNAFINANDKLHIPYLLTASDMNGDLLPELILGSLVTQGSAKPVQLIFKNNSKQVAGRVLFGKGYANSKGVVPVISTYGGSPSIGNSSFGISLSRCNLPNQKAVLVMFNRKTGVIKGPGFSLNVFPRWSIGTLTKGSINRETYAYVPLRIPNDPYLVGKTYYFQWVVADPKAIISNGVAVSQAMAVTFVAK